MEIAAEAIDFEIDGLVRLDDGVGNDGDDDVLARPLGDDHVAPPSGCDSIVLVLGRGAPHPVSNGSRRLGYPVQVDRECQRRPRARVALIHRVGGGNPGYAGFRIVAPEVDDEPGRGQDGRRIRGGGEDDLLFELVMRVVNDRDARRAGGLARGDGDGGRRRQGPVAFAGRGAQGGGTADAAGRALRQGHGHPARGRGRVQRRPDGEGARALVHAGHHVPVAALGRQRQRCLRGDPGGGHRPDDAGEDGRKAGAGEPFQHVDPSPEAAEKLRRRRGPEPPGPERGRRPEAGHMRPGCDTAGRLRPRPRPGVIRQIDGESCAGGGGQTRRFARFPRPAHVCRQVENISSDRPQRQVSDLEQGACACRNVKTVAARLPGYFLKRSVQL